MGVGETGQIIGETGVGEMGVTLEDIHHFKKQLLLSYQYRKMENFRVVQFSGNFAVGRDPRKLKSAKYIPSMSKVKARIHKRAKIRFCSSHFHYINQTKTQV